jgi:hypothetical protein
MGTNCPPGAASNQEGRMARRYPRTVLLALLIPTVAYADVPDAQRHEVAHLLEFVRTSGCVIDRNGSRHPAREALAHIQQKYDYFRNRIDSTEAFIEYAASRSTVSGQDYRVQCPGRTSITTRAWLGAELARYRRRASGKL